MQLMCYAQIALEDRLAELTFAESSYTSEELDLCACLTYLHMLLKGAAKEQGEIVWD